MKKILTLGVVLALSTSMTLAATSYTSALKNAIKQDIETSKQEAKNYNQSVKNSIKKDLEAKAAADKKAAQAKADKQAKEAQAKKAEKLKELNAEIAKLNKEKAEIEGSKTMTYTEKTLRLKVIEKQLKYATASKEALK